MYNLYLLIDGYGFDMLFWIFIILIVIGFSPLNINKTEKALEMFLVKFRIFLYQSFIFFSVVVFSFMSYLLWQQNIPILNYFSLKIKYDLYWISIILLGSILFKFILSRYVQVFISAIKKKLRHSVQTENYSTIDDSLEKYKESDLYKVEKYIDIKKGCFLGLDEKNNPHYIPWDDYKEYNKEIIGATRSGKGVITAIIAYQKILKGWTEFFIDPKGDDYIPIILKKACEKTGKKFIIIDFVDGSIDLYAPFRGGTLNSIKNRLKSVLKIREAGTDADHYKIQDIVLIDEALENTNRGIPQIYDYLLEHRSDPKKVSSLELKFKSLKGIKQILPGNGKKPHKALDKELLYPAQPNHKHVGGKISIARAIMESQVVYIKGDVEDANIKILTRLILSEIVQETKRLKHYKDNHTSIDIDETKFVMGETVSNTMSVILGYGCDVTLQYQSIEDIRTSTEKDVNMEALAESIHQNTQIKIVHGGLSDGTAEYAMNKTGTIVKKIDFAEKTKVKDYASEVYSGEKTVKNHEEALFTENDFLSMPQLTFCILQKAKKAKILRSSFMNVKGLTPYHELEK